MTEFRCTTGPRKRPKIQDIPGDLQNFQHLVIRPMSVEREHQIDENRSQDIIVLLDDMLPAAKRDVAATLDAEMTGVVSPSHSNNQTHAPHQMGAGLSWHLHALDGRDGVIEPRAVILVPALDGPPVLREPPLRRAHPLHRLGHEREQVVPPAVLVLDPAVRDAARGLQARGDLARVHGALENSGADEYGGRAVRVEERWVARELHVGEGGICGEGNAVAGRREGRGLGLGLGVRHVRRGMVPLAVEDVGRVGHGDVA